MYYILILERHTFPTKLNILMVDLLLVTRKFWNTLNFQKRNIHKNIVRDGGDEGRREIVKQGQKGGWVLRKRRT